MRDFKTLVRASVEPLRLDPARAADIVDELAQHVADHHAELVAAGMRDADAVTAALKPLENHPRVAEEIARADRPRTFAPIPPSAQSLGIVGNIARDARYAVRLLARTPGFAAAAIITLGLGIGANTAIFSVVDAVVLTPPPYRDVDKVVALINSRSGTQGTLTGSSVPDFEDWQRQATSFEQMGILSGWTFNMAGRGLPERLFGARVSGSLFPLLGTPALLGRAIELDDDRADRDEVVVLSHRLWRRLFGADPGIIGQSLMLEGRAHLVVGVMPPDFRFPSDDTEIWAAIKNNMTGMPREGRFLVAVARLKPSATLTSAQAEIDAITSRLAETYPETNRGWRVQLLAVHQATVANVKTSLFVLLGAVGLVLLIACVNVSSLLLARATSRAPETAIRLALGASRRRLVAQLTTENLVLALAGGAVGVGLAMLAVRLLVASGPADVPRLDRAHVDLSVLGFALVVSTLAGIAPSLVPALRAAHVHPAASLRGGGGTRAAGVRNRFGALLIVGEVTLAVTLAVAGGLLVKSFAALTAVPPGFNADSVLSLKVFLTPPRYRTLTSQKAFVRDALDRLAQVPAVESVAAISQLPLSDPSSTVRFEIDGRTLGPDERPIAAYRAVSPSYFSTLSIPILRGRGLAEADRETTPFVLVINDVMARRFWPGGDSIGQRIRWTTPGADSRWLTIVGVAADVRSNGLDKVETAAAYAPYMQRVFPWMRWMTLVVRTHGEPTQYTMAVRQALTMVDPLQPTYEVAPLTRVVAKSVADRRFHAWLLALFAALALALAAIGVYGTIGYWVSERSREIGVRMALGASSRTIAWMVVGRSLMLSAAGLVAGFALASAATRLLSTMLFNVSPLDPSTFAGVALVVVLTSLAAAYLPARRAARLDPIAVIRGQ